jgi:hypothetical protein
MSLTLWRKDIFNLIFSWGKIFILLKPIRCSFYCYTLSKGDIRYLTNSFLKGQRFFEKN